MHKLKWIVASLIVSLGIMGTSLAVSASKPAPKPAVVTNRLPIKFESSKNKAFTAIANTLSKSKMLTEVVGYFDQRLKLPKTVPIVFTSCDEENAYYDPEKVEISMCYELVQHYLGLEDKTDSLEVRTFNAAIFTLIHELGHALRDQLDLPITGKEEDAVDRFSALSLIELEESSALISGILQFGQDAEEEADSEEDPAFWDVHAFSMQRLYDMTCLAYGSDPDLYADLVEATEMPEDRSEGCEDEYYQEVRAWTALLKPHLKDPKKPIFQPVE